MIAMLDESVSREVRMRKRRRDQCTDATATEVTMEKLQSFGKDLSSDMMARGSQMKLERSRCW